MQRRKLPCKKQDRLLNPPLLSVKELSAQLGVSADWVYARVCPKARDPLPFIPCGRRKRFVLTEVLEHLRRRQPSAAGDNLSSANGTAWVTRKEKLLTRRRFQRGSVRRRTKGSRSWWEGAYREDVLQADGKTIRKQRFINLGSCAEIATKRLAERKLGELRPSINDCGQCAKSEFLVGDFIKRYEQLKLTGKKYTTQHGYKVILRKHIEPAFGKSALDDVTSEDVQLFINRKAQTLAYDTVKNIKWALSAVFTAAVKYGYAKQNPVRGADLPPEEIRPMPDLPSPQQLNQLMAGLDEQERMMLWVGCITGIRPSELSALRRKAIDVKRRCIWIVEAVNRGHFHTPKYHRVNRPIRLNEKQLRRLSKYMERSPEASGEDWLFPNKSGTGPVEYSSVLARKIQPMARKLGLPHITWRILRHWNSTVLNDNGVGIKVAQERMGHSRPETMLKHYIHLSPHKADAAADAISAALAAKKAKKKRKKLGKKAARKKPGATKIRR